MSLLSYLRSEWHARFSGIRFDVLPSIGRRFECDGADRIHIDGPFACDADCYLSAGAGGHLHIGNFVSLNRNVHINAACGGRITIGDDSMIGPNVVIRASNHRYEKADIPIRLQGHEPGEIVIGSNVWIGANVTILAGAVIGDGSIVAAGSVVRGKFGPFRIIGSPSAVDMPRWAPRVEEEVGHHHV